MATPPKKRPTKKAAAKKAGSRVTPKKAPPPLDIEALLAKKTPPVLEFPISADSQLADAASLAKQALDEINNEVAQAERIDARMKNGPGVDPDLLDRRDDAQETYDKAHAENEAVTINFLFQALPRPVLIRVYKDYPPTERQKRQFRDELKAAKQPTTTRLDFNEDTFPPVLIYMAMKEPEMTEEQVDTMWYGPICDDCEGEGCDTAVEECVDGRRPDLGVWSKAELDGLFLAASNINKLIK